jgi:hypothetical protein
MKAIECTSNSSLMAGRKSENLKGRDRLWEDSTRIPVCKC